MPLQIVRHDIVKMNVDAIVNAANTQLAMGGGVCGAIFKAAGAKELQDACNKIGSIKTGQAVITPGFHLPCKYVIHTAGPVYHLSKAELCKSQLYSGLCCKKSLPKSNEQNYLFNINILGNMKKLVYQCNFFSCV